MNTRPSPRVCGNLRSLIGQFVTMRVDEVEHDAGSHHADVQAVENQGVRQRVVHKLRDDAKDMLYGTSLPDHISIIPRMKSVV